MQKCKCVQREWLPLIFIYIIFYKIRTQLCYACITVSNHRQFRCLFNSLLRQTQWKCKKCKSSALLALCELNPLMTGAFCFVYSKSWLLQNFACGAIAVLWWHTWWRHQMETFFALVAICAGNSPVPGEIPAQRPETRRFNVFFDLRRNKRLSKQSWDWWFEKLSRPLWRHCNDTKRSGMKLERRGYSTLFECKWNSISKMGPCLWVTCGGSELLYFALDATEQQATV